MSKLTPEQQLLEQCEELLDIHKELILRRVKGKFRSGAIPNGKYNPGHYVLAKILVTSALMESTDCFYPLSDEHRQELENLKHF